MSEFYKNKLTLEIEIETQFGPEAAVNLISVLNNVPAVTSINVTKLESNYDTSNVFPEDANLRMMNRIPLKLK
jgi:hypothetical protein